MSCKRHNPDVLSCLANLSSDEVFTPPSLVNELLDLLPAKLWSDKNARFLDPMCKSGVFLREIAKRLLKGLEKVFPELQERINHIFTKQLFGIALTELTALLSRRSVYCSKSANGEYSICNEFQDSQGNILFSPIAHTWKNGVCPYCGVRGKQYKREEGTEATAYNFIHPHDHKDLNSMEFDVIIGNPPYHLSDGGSKKSAMPIYDKFVRQAKSLNPRYLIMIIPSRWFTGGKRLDEFRKEMLNDQHLKTMVDFWDSRDCFPNVDIAGGVCYFLWDRDYSGDCEVTCRYKNKSTISMRKLNEFEVFIRSPEAVQIIKRIQKIGEPNMSSQVSGRNPFGLSTKERPSGKGNLTLLCSEGKGKIERAKVITGEKYIDQWKVITSNASYDHGGSPDKEGRRRVLSRIEVLPPSAVCTDSYIVAGSFLDEMQAANLATYMKTKFVRFLISQMQVSQHITKGRFAFVPQQDHTQKWTDSKLYKKYKLADEEIEFIENMIRPMEVT